MRIGEGYSVEFKKSAVEKLLTRGNRTVEELCSEIGISTPTIYHWRSDFANVDGMKKKSISPKNRSPEEKLRALMDYDVLTEEKRGEFLRKNGLYKENIAEWKKQIVEALTPSKKNVHDKAELIVEQKKIKELERELRRKDKALAEAAALLILKKKADLIWGTREEE